MLDQSNQLHSPISLLKPMVTILWLLVLAGCGQPTDLFEEGISAAQTIPADPSTPSNQPLSPDSNKLDETEQAIPTETAHGQVQVSEEPTVPIVVSVPVPTATQPPVSVPPFQTLDFNNLPPIQKDLAFVSGNKLHRWSAENQAITTVFEPALNSDRFSADTFADIRTIDFSADGKRAAVVVNYTQMAENSGDGSGDTEAELLTTGAIESDIFFIDMISQESWPIVESIKNEVSLVALSPDHRTVAFTTAISEQSDISGNLFIAPTPSNPNQRPLTQLHVCTNRCRNMLWRQDSELFVFMDESGVYLANQASAKPEIILENNLPGSESADGFNVHLPIAWAPNDRALLMLKNYEDGFEKAVFDLPTKKVISIPETNHTHSEKPSQVIWLTDSRLLVADSITTSTMRQLKTYRVNFDEGGIEPDESYSIETQNDVEIIQVEQLREGRFVYALNATDQDPSPSGLFALVSFSERPERRNGIPNRLGTPRIWWNQDGSEAIQAFGRQNFLATVDGNLFSFQDHAWGFYWLE